MLNNGFSFFLQISVKNKVKINIKTIAITNVSGIKSIKTEANKAKIESPTKIPNDLDTETISDSLKKLKNSIKPNVANNPKQIIIALVLSNTEPKIRTMKTAPDKVLTTILFIQLSYLHIKTRSK